MIVGSQSDAINQVKYILIKNSCWQVLAAQLSNEWASPTSAGPEGSTTSERDNGKECED